MPRGRPRGEEKGMAKKPSGAKSPKHKICSLCTINCHSFWMNEDCTHCNFYDHSLAKLVTPTTYQYMVKKAKENVDDLRDYYNKHPKEKEELIKTFIGVLKPSRKKKKEK